jgi:uncharacterized RDD family membrane protein YckC
MTAISANTTADKRRLRRILTPEGVELTVELGERGARAAAFLIDLLFAGLGLAAVVLAAIGLVYVWHGWGLALALLGFFVVRFFYFSYFELRWRGATPGKRLIGLRVIDRAGGPLRPEAVVARNLMREIEIFLPLSLMLVPKLTGASSLIQPASFCSCCCSTAMACAWAIWWAARWSYPCPRQPCCPI